MITISDLHFSYSNDENEVLQGLNLNIKDGEFLCLIGHSGCGKSTLVRLLAGLEFANAGVLAIDGKPISGTSTDRAVVFQQYSLFPWANVWKNVFFATMKTKRFSKKEAEERTDYFLKKTGMFDDRKKYPHQLSGGMRQRTAIARALAMDASILLLDEPFGALDIQNRKELQQLLHRLWQEDKKTVVFVTHDLDEALAMASRIVFLRDGVIAKELEISRRIQCCCMNEEGLSDCKDLRASLEEWYQ